MSNGSTHSPHQATPASTEKKLDEMYGLVEGIEIAMFTTRRSDGHLVSRPMATQARAPGADLWFVTDGETHKMDELQHDPHVNVSYYRDRTREWVSVSGTARVVKDPAKIHELYRPDWKAWFPDESPGRDGGPDDPRLCAGGGGRAHGEQHPAPGGAVRGGEGHHHRPAAGRGRDARAERRRDAEPPAGRLTLAGYGTARPDAEPRRELSAAARLCMSRSYRRH